MNNYEFTKLVDSADNMPINISTKLTNKQTKTSDTILVNPEEILELHYYSLSPEEQSKFLYKISNQEVNVTSPSNGIILISYNVNNYATRATTNYTSSREGTIKIQEKITGKWGSATVTLKGYFSKTTSGTKWTIKQAENDYDTSESSSSPVQIISNTVYAPGSSYTSSGTYKGNEISCHCNVDVSCGFQTGSLSIYVYPNSSYNYAKIN